MAPSPPGEIEMSKRIRALVIFFCLRDKCIFVYYYFYVLVISEDMASESVKHAISALMYYGIMEVCDFFP